MDGGAWWATVHGVTKCWTGLTDFTFTFYSTFTEPEPVILSVSEVKSLSRVRLCATPQTAARQAPRPWDSPGKNTGVGCHFLL